MGIENIRFYDYKKEGLDFKTYKLFLQVGKNINPFAASMMHRGLVENVKNFNVLPDDTSYESAKPLKKFLYGDKPYHYTKPNYCPKSYFGSNPNIEMVVFMDGKFHSQYNVDGYNNFDSLKLAKENNSIPFMFCRVPTATYNQETRLLKSIIDIKS